MNQIRRKFNIPLTINHQIYAEGKSNRTVFIIDEKQDNCCDKITTFTSRNLSNFFHMNYNKRRKSLRSNSNQDYQNIIKIFYTASAQEFQILNIINRITLRY